MKGSDQKERVVAVNKSEKVCQQALIYLLNGLSNYGDVKKIELFMLGKLLIYLSTQTIKLKQLAI